MRGIFQWSSIAKSTVVSRNVTRDVMSRKIASMYVHNYEQFKFKSTLHAIHDVDCMICRGRERDSNFSSRDTRSMQGIMG